MAVREILKLPDKRLRLVSAPVNRIDAGVRALVEDMFDTMYAAPGIGLAGIQIGVAKRVVVMDLSKKEEAHEPLVLINPEIVWTSPEKSTMRKAACRFPNFTKRSSGRAR
jgi:peptide deformylase